MRQRVNRFWTQMCLDSRIRVLQDSLPAFSGLWMSWDYIPGGSSVQGQKFGVTPIVACK